MLAATQHLFKWSGQQLLLYDAVTTAKCKATQLLLCNLTSKLWPNLEHKRKAGPHQAIEAWCKGKVHTLTNSAAAGMQLVGIFQHASGHKGNSKS